MLSRPTTPCVIWKWAKNGPDKYGIIWDSRENRIKRVHRVAYEMVKGPIPEGMELDHLCSNKACFNPDHLEPVTRKENMTRARDRGEPVGRKRQEACRRGHPYTRRYVQIAPNGNPRTLASCNECARIRKAARRAAGRKAKNG